MGCADCCWPEPGGCAASTVTCCVRGSCSQHVTVLAADGAANAAIARDLAVSEDTVRKWRRRFSENGVNGLRDLPRTGRPRAFPAAAVADVVAEVKALACELPADSDTPLAK